ncbi:hypothetical protein HS088_TW12G01130 [Tripterygium wilfordii]|uniref:C3H1-type domain-containing protein n=1 Tax=Tripterygium wilfordii TaxID=458696 RepID=A0A7J7D1G6_TRIWF|nr:zinc finger CCCH domain-containing protein 3 [Tripterygium wilfordii]XP_038717452.1 zinc finger CCCH domain-containing protein 3 [Tripterygium wilfordii]KAF5739916.1 hypothetical protein HS088_TW12G01130 [Tripterygium wilfordii]
MPLGKYYCDYCDKEFQDNPVSRRRHLQSSLHLKAKALWYDSFKFTDSNQSFPTNDGSSVFVSKGVCNRFFKTGYCPYGDSCKYWHPNNYNSTAQVARGSTGSIQLPVVSGNQLVGGGSAPGDVVRDSMGMSWGNLPPSLKPPPEGGYPPLPFVDWG